ncbi:hypothetical protein CO230_08620 [Chryseobacterium sp. 6424]|uniref:hypothetical protein n=1 Tax=Chryseobacterium sp. 6424 TaxID=2039166 RepID=UPI000EFD1488|nr:hypothetical protein [Chryseobacterium sp. 6424]AYO58177.1 hypothetical protein CO230_08620 [Chryseobacterium sp. 6424]
MATPLNTIFSWFQTGDFPTEQQFQATFSSFWHRDEAIPVGSIQGLAEMFESTLNMQVFNAHLNDLNAHAHLARRNASNLSESDANAWKARLNIGELPENIATYDYTKTGYVMMKDGTVLEVGDLGKNVANSKPTSVPGAGLVLGAPWGIDTGGQPMTITGLPDKSADATFDRVKVQNAAGQEAMVTNMYNILYKGLTGLTAQQATNISYLLNGGIGSDGPMSVNNISPPIIQNRFNSVEYILLRGVNLNLSAVGRKIEILAADKTTVVLTIPDNQIQTSLNGQELVFYYNFHNFPIGTYYVRITSGVKQHITELNIKIVQEIENINTSAITWDFVYDSAITPSPLNNAVGGNFTIVTPSGTGSVPKLSLKSSEIFAEGDDFYIELKVSFGAKHAGYGTPDSAISDIGLGYYNSANSLNRSSLAKHGYSSLHAEALQHYNNNNVAFSSSTPTDILIVFIKTGNLFRTIVGSSSVTQTFSNNSGYAIFAQIVGRDFANHTIQGQVTKAFKFN